MVSRSQSRDRRASTAVVVGGYLLALLLPPIGLIVGLVLSIRWGRLRHGVAICLLSVAMVVGFIVIDNRDNGASLPPAAKHRVRAFTHCMTKATLDAELRHPFRACKKFLP